MAHFLFLDESGQDHGPSPYEVLAGISIKDRDLWPLILAIKNVETDIFGGPYQTVRHEIKAKSLLKTKTFRLANECPQFESEERRALARECLDNPTKPTKRNLSALAQAKLAYVSEMLRLCKEYDCHAFAIIIIDPAVDVGDYLRKDYSYVFERYYEFLVDSVAYHQGIVVFDELEKIKCHLLINQLSIYFKETANGKTRAKFIVPEPFFVHSDLTTGIQIADVIAYVLSWGYQDPLLTRHRRPELATYASIIHGLRYTARRLLLEPGKPSYLNIKSIKVLTSLKTSSKRAFRR